MEKQELARNLIELGLHAKQEVLKREEFEAKKLQAAEFLRNKDKEKKRDLAYKAATTA